MDNMPDFDSMTPEEMMAWMEALAKRQGAVEGLVTSGDMEVPEIDPTSVGQIDEPGYIPFGMDPEVWEQKKAKEDAERAQRIAAFKAEKGRSTGAQPAAPPPSPAQPAAAASPLDFLADMSGMNDSPDTSPVLPVMDMPEPALELPGLPPVEAAAEEVPLEDLFADLGAPAEQAAEEVPLEDLFADLGALAEQPQAGDMDWLASLGQSANLPDMDNLDFGSLDILEQPAAQGADNPLEWLESLVGNGDSEKGEAVSAAAAAEVIGLDDMLIEDENDILEDSAVSAVLNDPMEWLKDFSDTESMDAQAIQDAPTLESPQVAPDLNAFFDRLQTGEADALNEIDFDLNRPMGEIVDSGLMDFGGTPDFIDADDAGEQNIGAALTQGAEVPAEDVKAWMDSLLDRGIQRTDVVDIEDEESIAEASELPAWLVEQVGAGPTTEEMLAASEDLPDWLTAPVSDTQAAEFEEMFNQITAPPEPQAEQSEEEEEDLLPEAEPMPAPLDTGVIRVQMGDTWVEAFELERDEKLSETGKLAAWYESAAHEVEAARQAELAQSVAAPPSIESLVPTSADTSLTSAVLPDDEELPPGEQQSVPAWLGGGEISVATAATDEIIEPKPSVDEELPDWLRAAQLQSDEVSEVPAWLTDSLSTDEFEILQLGSEPPAEKDKASIQDEPTTPVPVQPSAASLPLTTPHQPISQRPTSELPRMSTPRPPREKVPVHEVANVINQARASQKMGDIAAMLDSYERLIRSEVGLEEVEVDMERVSKDAVQKTNPAVLRVYGDVLLRRGKLQQALDTYRAALNLL